MTMHNIVNVDQPTLLDTMRGAFKLNRPLFIWGSPGIGKSDITRAFTQTIGGVLCDIRLAQYDAVDIRGLPDVNESNSTTVWYPPSTLPFEGNDDWPDDRPIVLILDEAMQAAQAVQSVAFQLVLDQRVGEHRLKKNVWICAASNRETDRAGVNKMLSPLANRFMHVQLRPTLDGWKDWAYDAGMSPISIGYLNARPAMLDQSEEAQKASIKAFPTPRSWHVASDILNTFSDNPELRDIMLAATVGEAVSAELSQFARMSQALPTYDQIVEDPDGTRVPTANDECYALMTMLSMRTTAEDGAKVVTYVKRFEQQYAVLWMADMCRREPTLVINSDALLSYQTELHSVLYG